MDGEYEFDDLRLSDLLAFAAVQRSSSLTAAARELNVTPSQLSKALVRLERHSRARLFDRTSRGVSLTVAGTQAAPMVSELIGRLRALRIEQGAPPPQAVTVAAPSSVLAPILASFAAEAPGVRVRGLEIPPAQIRPWLTEDIFDVAVLPGGVERLPSGWTSDAVGSLRAVLFGTPSVAQAFGPMPVSEERVRGMPFVGPTYLSNERFVAVHDDCPIAEGERVLAHECNTITAALELAVATGSLVFGPRISARRFVENGLLVEIPVEGWSVAEPVLVLCNAARVLSKVRASLVRSAARVLA